MKTMKYLTAAISLAAAAALQATSITYTAADDGLTLPSGVASITATGGTPIVATKNSQVILGVKGVGGDTNPEIEPGESLTVSFDSTEKLAYLTLALLFNGPEYGDIGEVAGVIAGGSAYYLKVTGENTADWYKGAVYIDTIVGGSTTFGGAGLFTIWNPFGNSYVDSMKFWAVGVSPGPGKSNTDYGVSAFATVPEAGSTLALLGVALLGLAGMARRIRA